MKILTKITKSDFNFTLQLRNNKSVRNNFFNSNTISRKEHKEWFLNKIKNKNDLFLIILKNKSKIELFDMIKKNFITIYQYLSCPNTNR